MSSEISNLLENDDDFEKIVSNGIENDHLFDPHNNDDDLPEHQEIFASIRDIAEERSIFDDSDDELPQITEQNETDPMDDDATEVDSNEFEANQHSQYQHSFSQQLSGNSFASSSSSEPSLLSNTSSSSGTSSSLTTAQIQSVR